MSLLDEAKSASVPNENVAANTAAPAKKSSAAEYQRKMKEKIYQAGLLLKSALERGKVDLSNDEKAAIELICRKPGQGTPGGSFGKPLIYRFFGDKPVVGATIKALKIFEDTGKGFHEINQQIKKWAEKGNIVTYDVTTKVYKLDKIGVLPDYVK